MSELLTKGIRHTKFQKTKLGMVPVAWYQTTAVAQCSRRSAVGQENFEAWAGMNWETGEGLGQGFLIVHPLVIPENVYEECLYIVANDLYGEHTPARMAVWSAILTKLFESGEFYLETFKGLWQVAGKIMQDEIKSLVPKHF